MRRLILCLLGVVAALASLSAVGAADGAGGRSAAASCAAAVAVGPGLPVWLDGKELEFTPASATVNGALFVPAVRLADALGVKWESAGGQYVMSAIKAASDDTAVTFRAGVDAADRNGAKLALPAAPYIDDDWLYVPLRAFAEAFGYIVRWDELKHAVVLEKEWTALPAVGTEEKLQELLADAEPYGGSMKVTVTSQKSDASAAAPSAGAAANVATPEAAVDYSRTNVQVAGVDEGDLVKTDGTYLYKVSGRQLAIVRAVPAAELQTAATVTFDDERFTPRELYVGGDKLVVIGRSLKPALKADAAAPAAKAPDPAAAPAVRFGGKIVVPLGVGVTKAIVYDIADRSAPKAVRTVELQGDAIATRKIGSVVYMVANAWARSPKSSDGGASAPAYRDSAAGGASAADGLEQVWPTVKLPEVRYFPGTVRAGYLLVGGFDLDQPQRPLALSSFLGAGQNVYVSGQSLYVTQTEYARPFLPAAAPDRASIALRSVNDPVTTVYRFKLDGGYVRYTSQGDVPGAPLNPFSMDENDDVFRIATTRDNGSALYTLDQSMQVIGRLEGIAPGERMYSARFAGGRAYLVTFKQVDPLFVIDVSNPRSPAVLGALKIPGYSDYLHPYDATHLIGFGKETVQDGKNGAVLTEGMKVSLFDVSDVANPLELFKTTIGDRGTESELLHDHKALLFDKDKGLLAFPVAVREVQAKISSGMSSPRDYGKLTFEGAYVYHLDVKDGFQLRGRITHVTAADQLKAGYDGYYPTLAVKRALYIGDTLYTVSDGAVKANAFDTLAQIGELRFAGQ